MRFIGNKELITSAIFQLLEGKDLTKKRLTLFDAFCGTGAVSDSAKGAFNIVANDMLRWCGIYTRGRVCAPLCNFKNLGFDPFSFFNKSEDIVKGFFYKNYSPGGSKRMYFSEANAGRIDYFRTTIEAWKNSRQINENEYSYLLASLIETVSMVSNTAGVYGAFLKHWDSRAKKVVQFRKVGFSDVSPRETKFLNAKAEDVIAEIDCDILYIDPPYTQNQYGTQYHLLETLVLYDSPAISTITGSRSTSPMRSDWSKEYKAHILFDRLVAKTKAKYIVFSYSKDGFLSKSFIEASLKRYGKPSSYLCKKISFRNYTNTKSRNKNDHLEYLFFIEKKEEGDIRYESPLNYIGGKAKLVTDIKKYLPGKVSTFIDACGGGFNVGVNISANRILYNDVNHFVRDLILSFRINDTYQYIRFVKGWIRKYGLEKAKASSYLKAREYYNSLPLEKRDPRMLYTLILYGFNQQIRFNSAYEFNNPIGMRWFNDKVLEKMVSFSRALKEKNIIFESMDFRELHPQMGKDTFVYLDPPYMLTNGAYNDGKRGFHGWTSATEKLLFDFVDRLNSEGKRFMISYVLEHNGKFNTHLDTWIRKTGYRLIQLAPVSGGGRKESLIVNY